MRPYAQPALHPYCRDKEPGEPQLVHRTYHAPGPSGTGATRARQPAAGPRLNSEVCAPERVPVPPGSFSLPDEIGSAAHQMLRRPSGPRDRDWRPTRLWGHPSQPGPVTMGLTATLGAGGATGIAKTGPRILSREARTASLLVWEQAVLAPRPLEMDLAAPGEARPPLGEGGGTMRGLLTADQLTMERRPRLAASCINHQGGYPKWARTGSTGRATSC